MYTTYRDPPHIPSPLTRKIWRGHKHLAKVSRSVALHRVQNGWTILDAITMSPRTKDQSDNIIAFLEKYPLASRETIAKAINRSGSNTLTFLESLMDKGKVFRSVGKNIKNRPVYFYSLSSDLSPELKWDRDAEEKFESKPFINPIRQRALDDLEKLKKMKQK